jgi:hypothetical protein
MKYADIKIVEQTAKEISDYDDADLFKLVIKVDSQKELFAVDKVPYSLLLKGKEAVYKKMTEYIDQYAPKVPKPFKILSITTVDKNGEERPLEDILPSLDGEDELAQDVYNVVPTVDFGATRILEFRKWLAKEEDTEFIKDSRSTYKQLTGKELTKDNLRSLKVLNNGALVNPATNKMIGAVAGTPAVKQFNKAVKDGTINAVTVGVIAPGYGGSLGSGEEGESGLSGEQAGSAPDIADEIYESIDGMGTDEGRLLKALARIETRPHLFEVIKQYNDKYKSTMSTDLINDFKYDLGKSQFLIDEINDVMSKLGYVLYGSKFFTLTWIDIDDIKMNGNYVGYQPKIGWHKGVIITIKGQSFGVSPFKKDGWFGTSVGAKYAMGRVEPRDNPNAPESPSVISGQISRFTTIEKQFGMQRLKGKWIENLIDNYIEDNINDSGIMPPVKAGDTVDNDVYRQLTFLGEKGNGMLWSMYDTETQTYSKLSQEAADAVNNFKGDK